MLRFSIIMVLLVATLTFGGGCARCHAQDEHTVYLSDDMPCRVDEIMTQLQIAGVKQIYGIVACVAAAVLVAVLIYDMPLSRERNGWMPSWIAVGKVLRRRLTVTKGRE